MWPKTGVGGGNVVWFSAELYPINTPETCKEIVKCELNEFKRIVWFVLIHFCSPYLPIFCEIPFTDCFVLNPVCNDINH